MSAISLITFASSPVCWCSVSCKHPLRGYLFVLRNRVDKEESSALFCVSVCKQDIYGFEEDEDSALVSLNVWKQDIYGFDDDEEEDRIRTPQSECIIMSVCAGTQRRLLFVLEPTLQ